VVAWFNRTQLIETTGDSSIYNGLEVDDVGGAGGQGTSYRFCPTCGSTVYWTIDTIPDSIPDEWAEPLARSLMVAVGNFADADFPPPEQHLFPELQPRWLTTHPEAE
jgi:hypothetical protein